MSQWLSGSLWAGARGTRPTNTTTHSLNPEDRGGPPTLGSQAAGLPQPGILDRLIDAMKITPRGVVGWRLCPAKLDRQPAFLMRALPAQHTTAAVPHCHSTLNQSICDAYVPRLVLIDSARARAARVPIALGCVVWLRGLPSSARYASNGDGDEDRLGFDHGVGHPPPASSPRHSTWASETKHLQELRRDAERSQMAETVSETHDLFPRFSQETSDVIVHAPPPPSHQWGRLFRIGGSAQLQVNCPKARTSS